MGYVARLHHNDGTIEPIYVVSYERLELYNEDGDKIILTKLESDEQMRKRKERENGEG